MKTALVAFCFVFLSAAAFAETEAGPFTLSQAIEFSLGRNPAIRSARKDVEIGRYRTDAARAGKMPKLDLNGGVTRYRYPAPVTPISGSPLEGAGFPRFDNTLYDAGVVFTLPLYKGGRLDREVAIAEIRRTIAEDMVDLSRQELIYNITSVYYKIYELEKLLQANEASAARLEAHRKNVELFLRAGTVPRIELLKTDAELAHARQAVLLTRNNLESTYELLKEYMGIEQPGGRISLVHEPALNDGHPGLDESVSRALSQRPDYKAAIKELKVAEERVKRAAGKRLPFVYLGGEYSGKSGERLDFRENWNLGLRLTVPLFDGGTITSEVNSERKEMEKRIEDERSLRLAIIREIKDSHLNIKNARERIDVSQTAIESARETLRVERLKYETGKGTSTDVIDAQTALLRAETDHYQALYDKDVAVAALQKAMGEERYGKEEAR